MEQRAGTLAEPAGQRPALQANPGAHVMFDKARAVTEFCIKHGGDCFKDWPVPLVFNYVFYHLVDGGCFVVRANGEISAVMFAWGLNSKEVLARHQAALSPFAWQRSRNNEDAIFLAEVIGERSRLGKLFKMAAAKWPDWQSKTIFTYRDGSLVELPQAVIKQFIYGQRAGTPASPAGGDACATSSEAHGR